MWGAGGVPSSADDEVGVESPTGGTMSWSRYSGSRKVLFGGFNHIAPWLHGLHSSILLADSISFINSSSSRLLSTCCPLFCVQFQSSQGFRDPDLPDLSTRVPLGHRPACLPRSIPTLGPVLLASRCSCSCKRFLRYPICLPSPN